jgi:hypothetical protein
MKEDTGDAEGMVVSGVVMQEVGCTPIATNPGHPLDSLSATRAFTHGLKSERGLRT